MTTREHIVEFWDWFSSVRPVLEEALLQNRPTVATALCGGRLSELGLELPCDVDCSDGRFSLMLFPCGNKTWQFIARYWRQLAPDVPGWTFHAARPPQPVPDPYKLELGEITFESAAFSFRLSADEERQKYNVTAASARFKGQSEPERRSFCMMLFYLFLGEVATELYIGALKCTEAEPTGEGWLSFSDFCEAIRVTPATRPWARVDDPTTLCYAYHAAANPAVGTRGDIRSGFTRHVTLLRSQYDEVDMLRAHGGSFCYFYYPLQSDDAETIAQQHNLLSNRLEQLLETYRLGYLLGSAFGEEFNYLDMIIFDEPVFRAVFQDPAPLLGLPVFLGYFGGRKVQ